VNALHIPRDVTHVYSCEDIFASSVWWTE